VVHIGCVNLPYRTWQASLFYHFHLFREPVRMWFQLDLDNVRYISYSTE